MKRLVSLIILITIYQSFSWEKTYEGYSFGSDIIECPDSSLIILSNSIVKVNKYGENLQVLIDSLPPTMTNVKKFIKTTDNNFVIIGGDYDSTAFALKYDFQGNLIWSKKYSFTTHKDHLYYLTGCATSDSGFSIMYDRNENGRSIWVLRFDKNGDTLWTTGIEKDNENYTNAVSREITETTGKQFVITGECKNLQSTEERILFIKLNSEGEVITAILPSIWAHNACVVGFSHTNASCYDTTFLKLTS